MTKYVTHSLNMSDRPWNVSMWCTCVIKQVHCDEHVSGTVSWFLPAVVKCSLSWFWLCLFQCTAVCVCVCVCFFLPTLTDCVRHRGAAQPSTVSPRNCTLRKFSDFKHKNVEILQKTNRLREWTNGFSYLTGVKYRTKAFLYFTSKSNSKCQLCLIYMIVLLSFHTDFLHVTKVILVTILFSCVTQS